jgi:hypothetical protein
MALLDKVIAARQRLQKVHLAQNGWDTAKHLGELRSYLEQKRRKLAQVIQSVRLLQTEGIPIQGLKLQSTASKLRVIAEKFSADPVPGTLKTGSRWPQLLNSLDAAITGITDTRNAAWEAHVTALFSGDSPDHLDVRLAKTPKNVEALRRYRPLYELFASLKRTSPSNKLQLDEIREYSDKLGKIIFERNVPEDIKKFFAAAVTSSGFELSQLTQSILDYLRKHDLIAGYIVRQRLH